MSESLRILVVDDDDGMGQTLRDILKYKGYEVEIARSGADALTKVEASLNPSQARPFDCVLSDIRMPGLNGVETYKAIRAKQPDLPVVLMSAYLDDDLVKEGLAAGAMAALTKPLNLDLVLDLLSHLAK